MTPTTPAYLAQLLTECLAVLYTINPDAMSQQVSLFDLEARCEKAVAQLLKDKNAENQTVAP